ncbi:MAG: hypothetical protein AAB946_01790, partial [Patescibacteria group bacterium]
VPAAPVGRSTWASARDPARGNFRHLPIIAKALSAYDGAMILVSHVPDFVSQIRIDEVLELGK